MGNAYLNLKERILHTHIEEGLSFFGADTTTPPYTLKKRYHSMQKIVHPDKSKRKDAHNLSAKLTCLYESAVKEQQHALPEITPRKKQRSFSMFWAFIISILFFAALTILITPNNATCFSLSRPILYFGVTKRTIFTDENFRAVYYIWHPCTEIDKKTMDITIAREYLDKYSSKCDTQKSILQIKTIEDANKIPECYISRMVRIFLYENAP